MNAIKRICLLVIMIGLTALLCPYAQAIDMDLRGIPLPASTKIIWQDKAVDVNNINASAAYLISDLSYDALTDFYKGYLEQKGWELSYYIASQGLLCYVKEGKFLYVDIIEMDGRRNVYIVSSPKNLSICHSLSPFFIQPVIAPDAEGKDMADVPRFPGSRRRLNIFTREEGKHLLYETNARPKEIAQFYKSMLGSQGWQEFSALNTGILNNFKEAREYLKDISLSAFQKNGETLFIMAYPTPQEMSSSRTMIAITRNFEDELYADMMEEE